MERRLTPRTRLDKWMVQLWSYPAGWLGLLHVRNEIQKRTNSAACNVTSFEPVDPPSVRNHFPAGSGSCNKNDKSQQATVKVFHACRLKFSHLREKIAKLLCGCVPARAGIICILETCFLTCETAEPASRRPTKSKKRLRYRDIPKSWPAEAGNK